MALFGAGLNQVSRWDGGIANFKGWFDQKRDNEMIIKGYNMKFKY
ncbi:hypothetical protein [Desertivirga arenae]|nr:hypothetical protein [Pedobacter sp. SYSU D00823]